MVSSDLPQEILFDIFSRLSAKSVGQCRCLSKPWRDILSSPHFIKSHLNRKGTHQEILMLISRPGYLIHTIFTISYDAVSRKRKLLDGWIEVVGCCDGLALLINDDCETLINPVTREVVKIPESPLALPKRLSVCFHGFGYDSCIDDYKIVTLSSYCDTDDVNEPPSDEMFVDVYCVKRGMWTRLESSPYDPASHEFQSGTLLSGALHWLAYSTESTRNRSTVIAAFNLVDEVFTEFPAPAGVSKEIFWSSKLAVIGGCLCMFGTRNNGPIDIWIMKEYGAGESWTKFSINDLDGWKILNPLCFIGDDELVLLISKVYGQRLVIYNLKERSLKDMIVDGVPTVFVDGSSFDGATTVFVDGSSFIGSLVSPYFT